MADQNFTVKCGFFDAINKDRVYTADDMNKPYKRVVADGVFAMPDGTPGTDLQVVSDGLGMRVQVKPGEGIFAAKWFQNPSTITIAVPSNFSLDNRIDSVIVQVDDRTTGRVGNIVYRTGEPAASPAPPALSENAEVVEYRLANVTVASGATAISNTEIVDLRGSSSCPWVAALINQPDLSQIWQNFYTAYQNQLDAFTAEQNEYIAEQRQAWADFMNQLTEELTVSTNIITFKSTYTALGTVTTVPINISSYNNVTDTLLVYINGMLATPNMYTESGTDIVLTNSVREGTVILFVCFHALVSSNLESTVSAIEALNARLDEALADTGWSDMQLSNDASAADSSSTPGKRKIGKQVYLRGEIKLRSVPSSYIALLPPQLCPAIPHNYTTMAWSSDHYALLNIKISTYGGIYITKTTNTVYNNMRISLATTYLANG